MRGSLLSSCVPLASFALVALTALPAAADDYEDAFALSRAQAERGDLAAAALVLERALPRYPQDYDIVLQIAWLHYQAARYADAERFYREALARGRGAAEARLGLALSLERQGRCDEARPELAAILAAQPDDAPARAGLARCAPAPAWTFQSSLSATAHFYPDSDIKATAASATAGVSALSRSGWLLGATYRFTRFWTLPEAPIAAWNQHEGYLEAGYGARAGGLSLEVGLVGDPTGVPGPSQHVGLSGRLSPFGDLVLNLSASFYKDMTVTRAEPSWRIPIEGGLSVRPGAALERADGETLATGMLTLAYEDRVVSAFIGGKYGDEVRPAYLSIPIVMSVPERIKLGVWAGVSMNVGGGLRIQTEYTMNRGVSVTGGGKEKLVDSHFVTLGISKSF